MIRIILSGCCGKMGRAISELVKSKIDLSIVAGIDNNKTEELNYPIFSNISDCTIDGDVILDFSRPSALEGLLNYSLKKNLPIVLCTTGFTQEQIDKINDTSKIIPVFRSANMSIGINVLNNVLKSVSSFLYENYDIEIIEKHHNQKVDAPSGTALLLADTIKDSIPQQTKYVFGREGSSKREKKEIGIHAIRGGSIVGEHDVIFAGNGEIIEFNHTAISRDVFAVGALKACEFMKDKPKGMYSMDDVINSTKK